MSTGRLTSWPITVVASSRAAGRSATCGRSRSSENAVTLSFIVTPASAPATRARYTPLGSCRRARRWASATVSNQSLVLAISELRDACRRGDPEDGPAARTDQVREPGHHRVPGAGDVGADRVLVDLRGHLIPGLRHADPGVGHDHVQPAQLPD